MSKQVEKLSTYGRLKKAGLSPFVVPLTQEQRDILAAVAEAEHRSMTQTLIFHGFESIRKIWKKIEKSE
jgi:hypothetical protein